MIKALRVSALVLLLAGSANAGWMPNGTPEPPPPAPTTIQTESEENTAAEEASDGGVLEIVSSLLTSLGSLL